MLKSTKIIITIGFIVILLINTFTTQYVSAKNWVVINGHFSSINYIHNRGDHSYNIQIIETDKTFSTGEFTSHCFAYDAFRTSIKKGDPIEIYTYENGFFTNPEVVGLVSGRWQYMPLDCVNKQFDKNKFLIPLEGLFYAVGLTGGLIAAISKFKTLRDNLRAQNRSTSTNNNSTQN